ncbi:MAG TPA: alpha/beta fold hydrolase, partial [Chloroflexota bacterium]
LDCPEVASAVKHSTDLLGEQFFGAYGDAYRACADRLTANGLDLSMYGLPRQVEDLEAARVALGYDRIDLLSQSAGTRTAMIYAGRYPERIYRSVMIGVNPPGHFLSDPRTMDEQIGRYAELCAVDAGCRKRTDDLAASLRRTAADMPDRWLGLSINASNVRVVTFFALPESTPMMAPPSAPLTLDAWLSAAEGDASGFWLQSLTGEFFPWPFVWGQYAAAARLDAGTAREYFATDDQDRGNLAWDGSAFAWGGGRLANGWPSAPDEDAYSRARLSEVETLLIGGALDTATPPQFATRELLPYLPNGKQVVLPGFGHIASFFTDQPQAGTHLINTFFASGRVDDSLYEPQTVELTPPTTLTRVAKMVAGTMVGLALLTVLSPIWMARRVYQRGRLGYLTSATLRSVYPILLGLGGWFVGGLIIMTTLPSVRLDEPLLVVLSVSAPIGLGIYFSWVHRDWPARARNAGLTAAVGGALVGAWLGVNIAEGLVAPVTAIISATVSANLILIVLDIARARSARHPVTPSVAVDSARERVPA